MIVVLARRSAAITAARPTPPAPVTGMESRRGGRATLSTAPAPVWMPQPKRGDELERHVVVELDDVALVADRVRGEARLPEEVRVDRLAVARQRRAAVVAGRAEVAHEKPWQ